MSSRVTVGEELPRRAVVKEERLRWVCLQQRRLTPKGDFTRVMVKASSKMQTVTNGCVSWRLGIEFKIKHPKVRDHLE